MSAEVSEVAHGPFKREVSWRAGSPISQESNFSQLPIPGLSALRQ